MTALTVRSDERFFAVHECLDHILSLFHELGVILEENFGVADFSLHALKVSKGRFILAQVSEKGLTSIPVQEFLTLKANIAAF